MKSALPTITLILLGVIGCQSSKKMAEPAPSSAELNAPVAAAPQPYVPPAQATTPPPAPAPAPIAETPAPAPAPAAASASAAPITASKYTIQQGDSLFKIAKRRYGNGMEYKKILQANPGLDPDHLKVGKTINLP